MYVWNFFQEDILRSLMRTGPAALLSLPLSVQHSRCTLLVQDVKPRQPPSRKLPALPPTTGSHTRTNTRTNKQTQLTVLSTAQRLLSRVRVKIQVSKR